MAAGDPLGCEVCENFLPTRRGLRVRGGTSRAAYITDPVVRLMPFISSTNPKLFAASADAIYDISSLNPTTAPGHVVGGMTSGDWAYQQVSVAGGSYLLAVNGADNGALYTSTGWNPIVDEAISDLAYDALTADFEIGETVSGGTSGASATIFGIVRTDGTTGTLKIGTVTNGPFQDDEAITSASGSADADGAESAASSISITGVDTSDLCHVWLYKSRLFFIEKDSLKAWYLPTGQVGGAALDINLGGVFHRGGSLAFGATWSLDAGDGADDKCVFVSDQGEVAIYTGSDPSTATDWAIEGRYDIGKPLSKRGVMQAGGDLLIATKVGIVPLSESINKDPAALSMAAVSRNIERTWTSEVSNTSNVELHKWSDENLMLTTWTGAPKMLTANLLTGAWAQQSGWQGDCGALYLGNAYVGRSDGRVYKLDDGGTDDGDTFLARACPMFNDLGDPTRVKVSRMARASFMSSTDFNYSVGTAYDYNVSFPSSAQPAVIEGMVWGTSNWGEAEWGGGNVEPSQGRVDNWRSVSGSGYAIAPTIQVTSGAAQKISVEFVRFDLTVEIGGVQS